ncbi:MAG: hypothetical protein AABZ44_07060 [Elusimicrobiota bacterium]
MLKIIATLLALGATTLQAEIIIDIGKNLEGLWANQFPAGTGWSEPLRVMTAHDKGYDRNAVWSDFHFERAARAVKDLEMVFDHQGIAKGHDKPPTAPNPIEWRYFAQNVGDNTRVVALAYPTDPRQRRWPVEGATWMKRVSFELEPAGGGLLIAVSKIKAVDTKLIPAKNGSRESMMDFLLSVKEVSASFALPKDRRGAVMSSVIDKETRFLASNPSAQTTSEGTGRYIASYLGREALSLPLERFLRAGAATAARQTLRRLAL